MRAAEGEVPTEPEALADTTKERMGKTPGVHLLLHEQIAAAMKMIHSVAARTIVVEGTAL